MVVTIQKENIKQPENSKAIHIEDSFPLNHSKNLSIGKLFYPFDSLVIGRMSS